jgi:hypothetical protein
MLIHIVKIVFGRILHKLEKLVSDPYLLYLSNKNMFKLNSENSFTEKYCMKLEKVVKKIWVFFKLCHA